MFTTVITVDKYNADTLQYLLGFNLLITDYVSTTKVIFVRGFLFSHNSCHTHPHRRIFSARPNKATRSNYEFHQNLMINTSANVPQLAFASHSCNETNLLLPPLSAHQNGFVLFRHTRRSALSPKNVSHYLATSPPHPPSSAYDISLLTEHFAMIINSLKWLVG